MPGKTKNLRDAEAYDQPNVKITLEQMLEEINAETNFDDIGPDDLTNAIIAERQNINIKTASDRAKRMIKSGLWRMEFRRGENGHKVAIYVKNK
jgi:hypothetical protein